MGGDPDGLFKAECMDTTVFHAGPYKTLVDVEYATAGWSSGTTTDVLHSPLAYVPPAEFEHDHYAAQQPQEQSTLEAAENP